MKKIKKLFCLLLSVIILFSTVSISTVAYAESNSNENNIITFGMYPQSKVSDEKCISTLNSISKNWKSYGYYMGDNTYGSMLQSDFMQYTDVTYNGIKYRGVCFNEYRPDGTINNVTDFSKANQYVNGYRTDNIYWFMYEPIEWLILDEKEGLLMSKSLLDAQSFSNTVYKIADEYYNDETCTDFANDYKTSTIRNWLNNDFYSCAFSNIEKNCIKTTTIDNFSDKVFLLSYNDVTNPSYGFSEDIFATDNHRIAQGSDYAKVLGLYVETVSGAVGNGYWSLRTPGSETILTARVASNGIVSNNSYLYQSCYSGIRPAIKVNLKSCVVGYYQPSECTHTFASPKVIKKPTCTAKGQNQICCTLCSYKYNVQTNSLGHKYKNRVVKPTYFATGYTLHTCSQCKKSYKDKKTAKLKVKAPTIKKPSTKSKSITVKWSKVKSVQGYEIQYSTDKKFKKNTKTIKVKKGSATSKTIKKLKKNKKYYVRVRAYKYQNKKYARSSWSKLKSIKVK